MEGDHDQERTREREDEDGFLEHHVAALLLIAQAQVIETRRHDEARSERGGHHQVLPDLGHQQREPGQRDRAQRDRDVMLDARELLGSAKVAEKRRRRHDDQPEAQRPDLALPQQLRLEAKSDRDQHHAREEEEAAVALGLDDRRGRYEPVSRNRGGLHCRVGSLNVTSRHGRSDPRSGRRPPSPASTPRRCRCLRPRSGDVASLE